MVVLQNEVCVATFHIEGGALVDFRLQPAGINPLSFYWEECPKGKENIFFRGHFLCLGRWGEPSPGEASKGHIKHGDFNQLEWSATTNEMRASMSAHSNLEGLNIKREIELDASAAVLLVRETVQNTHTVGRLYNMMQHPTLAAPFLDRDTIVDCNAVIGFDYAFEHYNDSVFETWPQIKTCDGGSMNLSNPDREYSSVFSFIVNPADEWGWITAFSPTHETVLGYLWKRTDYPWMAHWLHFEKGQLLFRGLEFGTTGVHKPMKEIWDKNLLNLLGENTCCFIDADEIQKRTYVAFLFPVPSDFKGVQQVQLEGNAITITEKGSKGKINIFHHLNLTHAFQK